MLKRKTGEVRGIMADMSIIIERTEDTEGTIGELVGEEFTKYALKNGIDTAYVEYCFVAKDEGKIAGVIQGHAYYKEVHIGDLIVMEEYRKSGVGSLLVKAVEEAFKDDNREQINLTTYGFQALEFYKKLGYEVEYVRKNKDENLTKYFLIKYIK